MEPIHSWDDLPIGEPLLKGIYGYGFENPSAVQKTAIPVLLTGKDVVVQAQSGTGKTATFAIAALAKVDVSAATTQVLVLSPTKELCNQTAAVFQQLGKGMDGLSVAAMYGGCEYLRSTPHVLCGCGGRVLDMLIRRKIHAQTIRIVVLDEADEMLSRGFRDQIYDIFTFLNHRELQVVMVSATLPENIHSLLDNIMKDPHKIHVKPEMLTLEGIKQFYVAVDNDRQKYAVLKDLFSSLEVSQCIIYCNRIQQVHELYEAMCEDQFPVCCIHGNMDKGERNTSFQEFASGKYRVLISSDITARGIDIQQVSIVINFDIPRDVHTYLHRIGRSGRWGRKGVGINFVTRYDVRNMKEIEHYYNTQIMELPENFTHLL
jgi:superfamily II DNA/RNA helicase